MDKKEIKLAKANGTLDKIYGQKVNQLIRARYSESEELAILRHKMSSSKAHSEEWSQFNSFVEECKAQAKEEMGIGLPSESND